MLRKYQKKVCPSVCLNPFALAGMREILKLVHDIVCDPVVAIQD